MDVVAQRDAIDQLRNDEGVALVGADVVDRQDIRMIQCACGASFLQEPLLTVGVAHGNAGEDLERHITLERGSFARYTSPMPPAPRADWISYGPRRVPGCKGNY